jgi:hypothetical protein
VAAQYGEGIGGEFGGIPVRIGNYTRRTTEIIEDDGTYGDSVAYIFWWDTKGVYHQHFFTGGQIIHVSSQPLVVPSIVLNLELQDAEPEHPNDPKPTVVKDGPIPPAGSPTAAPAKP